MMVALVTGASGFVGRWLVKTLISHGIAVDSFDRTHGRDIRSYESIRAAIDHEQPDLIFHLAAMAYVPESTTDPNAAYAVNVGGTLNLLEAVRHSGSRARVLIAGSSAEYGYLPDAPLVDEDTPTRPDTVYGATKLAASTLALVYGQTYHIPVVVTRAFNHTGPGQPAVYAIPSFARQIARIEAGKQDMLRHGNLQAMRNYTDVRNIVVAYQQAIELPPGVYNLGAPQHRTIYSILETLIQLAQSPVELQPDPGLYRPGMIQGHRHHPDLDLTKIHEACGWAPTTDLDQTLLDTLNYWRLRV